MRSTILAALLLSTITAGQARDFNLYPGFDDRDTFVEMTSDKGLIVEIVLRCEREGNKVKAGIMTFSKVSIRPRPPR